MNENESRDSLIAVLEKTIGNVFDNSYSLLAKMESIDSGLFGKEQVADVCYSVETKDPTVASLMILRLKEVNTCIAKISSIIDKIY